MCVDSTYVKTASKADSLTSEPFNKDTSLVVLNTVLPSHRPCDIKARVKRDANCSYDQLTNSIPGWNLFTKSAENMTKPSM